MALEQHKISQSKFVDMLAYEVGAEAYIFGFPLVLMDVTRELFARTSAMNQFNHARAFPDELCSNFVRPNVDTLYSSGFLDLSKEPILLTVPEIKDRYYLIQLMDAWTNIFVSLGTRTTGNRKRQFVITGPMCKSKLPDGIPAIMSPTSLVYISVRTQTNSLEDYGIVHAIQDHYLLTPLHPFGYPNASQVSSLVQQPSDAVTSPLEQVDKLDSLDFFNRMTTLMSDNPPLLTDANILRGLLSIGVVPGRPIKFASMKPAVARGIESGSRAGFEQISREATTLHGKIVNGWQFSEDLGQYGTGYLWRAAVATFGLGATRQADTVYARAACDESGARLYGSKRYLLHFAAGNLPPVKAFWSLTIYNDQQIFAPNPLNRFSIGDRDNLKFNPDGSVTLYIQHYRPTPEIESNWLPAPREGFSLVLRLYWPSQAILNGSWKPPRIEVVGALAEASA
jgi:hypothetical protein